MLKRLYNRFFVCPKWGHRPGIPVYVGSSPMLSEHCALCGRYLWGKR